MRCGSSNTLVNVKIGVDPQFWVWQASGRVDRWTLRKLPSDLDCTPVCRPLDTNKHKIQVQTQPHTQTQTITQQRWARTKYITNTIFLFQDCLSFSLARPQHPSTSAAGPWHYILLFLFLFYGEIGSTHFYNSWSYFGVGLNICIFSLALFNHF